MHLRTGRFIEPASWGEILRFLQLDSGPDPVFGRLTHIGAPPPRDTIILLAQVGYCHLLSREVPPQLPTETMTILQLRGVQMAFHMIQR